MEVDGIEPRSAAEHPLRHGLWGKLPRFCFCLFFVPKPRTHFCVRLTDGVSRIFLYEFFLTPMLRPGIEPTSVELHRTCGDHEKEALPTELHGHGGS